MVIYSYILQVDNSSSDAEDRKWYNVLQRLIELIPIQIQPNMITIHLHKHKEDH